MVANVSGLKNPFENFKSEITLKPKKTVRFECPYILTKDEMALVKQWLDNCFKNIEVKP